MAKPTGRVEYVPTPAEIRKATAKIRAGWTPADWARARGAVPAYVPTVPRLLDRRIDSKPFAELPADE